MRLSQSILMFFLFIPFLLIAQTKDTVVTAMDDDLYKSVVTEYYESGAVERVMYFSGAKEMLEPNAKETVFLKGEAIGSNKSNRFLQDSTKTYYEDGSLESVNYPRLALYESYIYNDEGEVIVLERIVMGQRLVFYGKGQAFEIEKSKIIVRGKIGENKHHELVLKNHSDKKINLKIKSDLKTVSLLENEIIIPAKNTYKLKVSIGILDDETFGEIIILRKDEEPISVPVSINAYD